MIEPSNNNPEIQGNEQLNLPIIAAMGTYEHY